MVFRITRLKKRQKNRIKIKKLYYLNLNMDQKIWRKDK